MYIFDAHTHFCSRTFYEFHARSVSESRVEALLQRLLDGGIDVPGERVSAHRDRFLYELDENGIDRAVLFASVPDEMEAVGEAALTSNGRLVPYAMVNPRDPKILERLDTLQPRYAFRGMLLFPTMGGYSMTDGTATPALDLAEKHGFIVFVHCGLLRIRVRAALGVDSDYPLNYGHPADLIPIVAARPHLKFIVPHFGAGFFDELLRLGRACPNVYVDTAGSNTWGLFQAPELTLADLFEQTAEVFGIERILYGSDTAGFPRGYRRDILEAQIRAMHDAGIRSEDQELILGGNLARLLEI